MSESEPGGWRQASQENPQDLEQELRLRTALLDNIPHCQALILRKGTHFIAKPFTAQDLLRKIKSVLASS